MALDRETRREIEGLKAIIRDLRSDVRRLSAGARTPQLGHSSIESGALEVRDPETGATRLRFGYQPDGRAAVVTEGGEPVTAPTAPTVTPMPSGLRVSWDGALADDSALPSDFDHVNVHVSEMDGFTPSEATFVVTIPRSAGAVPIAPLTVGTTYYVRLVPVTTGGIVGAPSAQASGVPAAVTDIAPGSITETEIADDAISTPKLRAEAVTALKIAAEAIEAGHIKAAAVTAAKLEAELVLGTRIIAGTPSGARVELDSTGIKGYNAADELVFVVDDAGTALFSGDIVASEISGSRMVVGTAPGPTGVIEGDSTAVIQRVQVGTMRAQLAATASGSGQANFLASSNVGDPSTPTAAFAAFPTSVLFALDSSINPADGLPSVTGRADASQSQLDVWSKRNSLVDPRISLAATTSETTGTWMAGSGSSVRIRALTDHASIRLTAPPATDPNDAQGEGYIFTQRYSSDIAAASLQGPVWSSGAGPERGKRAMLHAEGARPDRSYTRMTYGAARHIFGQQYDMNADATDTADGVVELASTHSMASTRHRPVSSTLGTPPTWTSPTTGSFVDFTSGQWPAITFKTSWSGMTEIIILMAGQNPNSDASSISVSFRLSGGGTLAADLARCALVRSLGTGISATCQAQATYFLQLNGNTTYTLTPAYRLSSWDSARPAVWDGSLPNRITVRPQS